MGITELRRELVDAREEIARGQTDQGLQRLTHAIHELESQRLTTTEAKEWLGIRSVNTLKLLVRKMEIQTVQHGNRMMIPVSELERLQNSDLVRGIRASDRLHEESADLGSPKGLSDEDLELLHEARPGKLPWSTRSTAAE
jgi:hypothetical protein